MNIVQKVKANNPHQVHYHPMMQFQGGGRVSGLAGLQDSENSPLPFAHDWIADKAKSAYIRDRDWETDEDY